jgi:hypothetical protein
MSQDWVVGPVSYSRKKEVSRLLPEIIYPEDGLQSGDILPQAYITTTEAGDAIISTILGKITYKGRPALVARIAYGEEVQLPRHTVYGEGGGFLLLDVQSGQISLSRSSFCVAIKTETEAGRMIITEYFDLHIDGTAPIRHCRKMAKKPRTVNGQLVAPISASRVLLMSSWQLVSKGLYGA